MGLFQAAVSVLSKELFELKNFHRILVIAAGLSDQFSRTYGLAIGTVVLTIGNIVSSASYHIWYVTWKKRNHPFLNGCQCRAIKMHGNDIPNFDFLG